MHRAIILDCGCNCSLAHLLSSARNNRRARSSFSGATRGQNLPFARVRARAATRYSIFPACFARVVAVAIEGRGEEDSPLPATRPPLRVDIVERFRTLSATIRHGEHWSFARARLKLMVCFKVSGTEKGAGSFQSLALFGKERVVTPRAPAGERFLVKAHQLREKQPTWCDYRCCQRPLHHDGLLYG